MTASAILDAAATWMVRARDPGFSDWDALTEWLEADPAHNRAYEAVFAAHDLAGERAILPAAPPAKASHPGRERRGWIAAGVAASAVAAILSVGHPFAARVPDMVAETRGGEQRLLRLEDGTQIALNGDSRLVLSRTNPRTARLERGEATFDVVHDELRPFTVDADGMRMIDLGTRFNVVRTARGSEVAVAEGAVLYDPEGAAVRLGPGRLLRKSKGSPIVEVARTDPAGVGAWRSGRLVYREAPLWRVADDIGRTTGSRIETAPEVANRPFTGAIVVAGASPAQLAAQLGSILDVGVAQRNNGLYLKARARR